MLDETWVARCCLMETAKDRREKPRKSWEEEIERTELNQRDHERRGWEENSAWWEFLNEED